MSFLSYLYQVSNFQNMVFGISFRNLKEEKKSTPWKSKILKAAEIRQTNLRTPLSDIPDISFQYVEKHCCWKQNILYQKVHVEREERRFQHRDTTRVPHFDPQNRWLVSIFCNSNVVFRCKFALLLPHRHWLWFYLKASPTTVKWLNLNVWIVKSIKIMQLLYQDWFDGGLVILQQQRLLKD